MSYEDLDRFTIKVAQLVSLLDSLDAFPGRRAELASCESHDEVVLLAKSWGFEIGKRWGE